jgi:hypothetical protein
MRVSSVGSVWLMVIAGLYLFGTALWSIRSGQTTMVYRTVKRREDPTGFWVSVVITGLLGLGAFVALLLRGSMWP